MSIVIVTRPIPESAVAILRDHGCALALNEEDRPLTRDELREQLGTAEGLLCTLQDPIDAALLNQIGASPLRVIANFAVGIDNIDLDAARERGIVVTNTPDVLTDATAEVAVGLILACARRFLEGDRITREGRFEGWAPLFHLGQSVYGRTVGIIGAGRIGRRVGETMKLGFGCRVLYHSLSAPTDLDQLLAESDFVSLHCPLTEKTHHLLDPRRIALMKPTAMLINTARGPVVDEAALVEALRDGTIAGAGLDVYENEPVLAPGLENLPNVVLLPHIGSATYATREAMGRIAAQSIVDVLAGKEPAHRVV